MSVENFTAGVENFNSAWADVAGALATLPGFSAFIRIAQVAGVLVVIYLAFLIFKGIMQLRNAISMKKLIKNVEEINHKLDKVIGQHRRYQK